MVTVSYLHVVMGSYLKIMQARTIRYCPLEQMTKGPGDRQAAAADRRDASEPCIAAGD